MASRTFARWNCCGRRKFKKAKNCEPDAYGANFIDQALVEEITDPGMTFSRPITDRYFEDYIEGEVHCFGTIAVETDEVIAFAKRFDPQAMHTDPKVARSGPFGGLIASGWHTAGLMMRQYVEHYLTHVASLASPGVDELRWLKPVRPGDNLSMRVTVLKTVPSKSKPDRGAVTSFIEVINQSGKVVMTLKVVNIIAKRSPVS
jgi:acyl dehydratase